MPKSIKNPCSVCGVDVRESHQAVFCDKCKLWCHRKCTSMRPKTYR